MSPAPPPQPPKASLCLSWLEALLAPPDALVCAAQVRKKRCEDWGGGGGGGSEEAGTECPGSLTSSTHVGNCFPAFVQFGDTFILLPLKMEFAIARAIISYGSQFLNERTCSLKNAD